MGLYGYLLCYTCLRKEPSEWIAYCKVETEAILELAHVVVGGFSRIVRGMDADTDIKTKNQELKVVANTCTCAHSQRLKEAIVTKASTWMLVVTMHEPHITGIEEKSTLKGFDQRETILCIHFQLHVT